jgi:peptidoglycan DL-endopeptidase CwlO
MEENIMTSWKKAVALSCLVCLVTAPTTVAAANLQDKLQEYQSQKSQLNSQLADQKKQVDSTTSQIVSLNQTVKALNASIATYKSDIGQQQKQLKVLNLQQQKLTLEKEERVSQLNKFIRANYEDGGATYINVLLGSSNWSDFLDRVYQVQCIMQKYNQLLADINKLNTDISSQQSQINDKTVALQSMLKEKENAQTFSQQALTKQQTLFSQLSAQQKATATAASNAQNKINIVEEQIRQQEEEAALAEQDRKNGINPDAPAPGGGITAPVKLVGGTGPVVNYAMQFVGVRYVWGGTSPSGWDCSGFVQYVYKHFGVSLYRVSQQQYTQGTAVAKSDLKPGDLVFFSTYGAGATHVGIYIGGGQMVNAASTRRGTVVDNISDNYWGPRYLGARRVVVP